MAQSILVPLGQQQRKLYLAPKQLQAYFAAMTATLPPAHRTFGPPPSPHASPQDPTGAWMAAQSVGTVDPRTWVPLRALVTLRVHINQTTAGTAFHLFGTGGVGWDPLSLHWWRAVNAIHQALFRLEARYLLGRAAFGTEPSPHELLGHRRETLEARVAQLIGPTNLGTFYADA